MATWVPHKLLQRNCMVAGSLTEPLLSSSWTSTSTRDETFLSRADPNDDKGWLPLASALVAAAITATSFRLLFPFSVSIAFFTTTQLRPVGASFCFRLRYL